MTDKEKIKKFDEIQDFLWSNSVSDDNLVSEVCSLVIKHTGLYGPNGEDYRRVLLKET